jgi:hypothetical protein
VVTNVLREVAVESRRTSAEAIPVAMGNRRSDSRADAVVGRLQRRLPNTTSKIKTIPKMTSQIYASNKTVVNVSHQHKHGARQENRTPSKDSVRIARKGAENREIHSRQISVVDKDTSHSPRTKII